MPKFTFSKTVSLKALLSELGVPLIFKPGAIGPKILKDEPAFVSDVQHKAVIEVDENGSKAAAVTQVMMSRCAVRKNRADPLEIKLNRPFNFYITYQGESKAQDFVLFAGRLNKVTQ